MKREGEHFIKQEKDCKDMAAEEDEIRPDVELEALEKELLKRAAELEELAK